MKTIKKMVVLLFLAMVPASAVEFSANDPAQVILDAADQPFVSFVNATIQVVLPPLPPPGDLSNPKLSHVRDLLLSRISSIDLNVNPARGNELVEKLTAMCSLRDWLLVHPVYGNIILTFQINETASLAVLAGLSNGSITTKDAKRIMDSLNKNPSVDALLLAAEGGMPKSKAIIEFKQKPGSESLLELSEKLGKEQGVEDYLSEDPQNYLKQIDSSEFIFNAIGYDDITYAAKLWVEYMSLEGNLSLEVKELKSNLEEKIPGIKGDGLKTPYTGHQLNWQGMEDLIKESRRWAATHSAM